MALELELTCAEKRKVALELELACAEKRKVALELELVKEKMHSAQSNNYSAIVIMMSDITFRKCLILPVMFLHILLV